MNALLQEVGSEKEEGRAGSRHTLFFFQDGETLNLLKCQRDKGWRRGWRLEVRQLLSK